MSSRTPSPRAPLIGRDRERNILHDHLVEACAGSGTLVLLSGEAGIGKTALAEALCHEARAQDVLVLTGRCYDLTDTPPYGPWLDLFERYHPGDGSPLGSMPPPPSAFATRGLVGAVASQAALIRQVGDFFAALCTLRPVVLLLEDLHWADPASLDLLRVLARALPTLPLLLLATYRADELSPVHPLTRLLPAIMREAPVARLDLRPLRAEDVFTLVAARYRLPTADTTRLATYVYQRAEGNPLFGGELLRTLEEEGIIQYTSAGWTLGFLAHVRVPPLLRQIIEGRTARLDGEAQRLLGIAAVLGQVVPLGIWGCVGEVDENALLPVIVQASVARLAEVSEDGRSVRFVHALIHEALYEGLSPPARRLLHCAAADALLAMPDPDPDAIASHLRRAGDPRAKVWLTHAGERAQRAYAYAGAAERYTEALAFPDGPGTDPSARGWLRYRLARVLERADPSQSRACLMEAMVLAGTHGDAALAGLTTFSRGVQRAFAGELRGGLVDMEAGVAALATLDPAERARLATHAAAAGFAADPRGTFVLFLALAGQGGRAWALGKRTTAESARASAGETADDRDVQNGMALADATLGRPDKARRAAAVALAGYRAAGNDTVAWNVALRELAWIILPYHAEDPDRRHHLATEVALDYTRATGWSEAATRLARLPFLVLEGAWDEVHHAAALALASPHRDSTWPIHAHGALGAVARGQGKWDEAWALVREALPAGSEEQPGDTEFLPALQAQRLAVGLALDVGDAATARAWLEAHDRWLAWSGTILGQSEGQVLWAHYCRLAGNPIAAHGHAQHALIHATAPRQPLALLAAHRLMGELHTDARHFDDAQEHLNQSLALAEACAAPFERALTLLALAALHGACGKSDAARDLLDEVRAICVPLGALPTLACADALAQRLTVALHRTPMYPAGLSAREVEVLRFVSVGLTNPQIAAHLFLSPRTVDQHLRSIYGKLGVSTRAAATRFALEHHLG